MAKTFDIMFSDLIPKARKKLFKFIGFEKPEDGNYHIYPLATISPEDVLLYREVQKKELKHRRKNNG